ncbi:hypothetical protein, partial [Caballeronia choica]|uniref:hypothetical protein n=1 Tax=Caballeronia choica TaxID=326476 RepID=UPI001F305D0D
MKNLLQMLVNLLARERTPSIEDAMPRAGSRRPGLAGSASRSRARTALMFTTQASRRWAAPACNLHRPEEVAERAADLQRPLQAAHGQTV